MSNKEFIESISLKGEIWKDVVGYEGLYMVSSFGRIASMPRLVVTNTYTRLTKHRILSPRLNSGGYYQITLISGGIRTQPHIHKVVAEAFIPNPCGYPQVDHIDCNKLNNSISNLRWCTQSMNNNNPITKARRAAKAAEAGKKISASKSIPVVRVNINNPADVKMYSSMTAAEVDGFYSGMISAVCSGKYSQHKGYKWHTIPKHIESYPQS